MKLFILKAIEGDDHWEPWYDKAFGFVVRARDETEARQIAMKNGGDEVGYGQFKRKPWESSQHSTCEELTPDGPVGMILQDFKSA